MPRSVARGAVAWGLQLERSGAIVWSAAPALTQFVAVGVCPAQTVSSRQPSATPAAGRLRRWLRMVIGNSSFSRMAEFTRDQTGVEPRHEGVDAEYWEAQALRQSTGVGHHVGAFEEHRANTVMCCNEFVAGGEDVALGRGDIEPLLVVDHDAGELAAVIGADDRCPGIRAGSA